MASRVMNSGRFRPELRKSVAVSLLRFASIGKGRSQTDEFAAGWTQKRAAYLTKSPWCRPERLRYVRNESQVERHRINFAMIVVRAKLFEFFTADFR